MSGDMKEQEHYLKKELFELVKKDDSIFHFIQEGSLDGMWYWDLEHPENEWMNARFWTTLGYDPATKSHHSNQWQDIIFEEDLAVALHNFDEHCKNPNHPYDQVVRYRHANGSTVWIRCRGMAIRDENGKPVRMLGAHTDITKEKEHEIELKSLLKKYESILNSQSALIVRFDENGRITYVNKYFQEFFKLSGKDQHNLNLLSFFNKKEVANLLTILQSTTDSNTFTITLSHSGGKEKQYLKFEISKIMDADSDMGSLEFQGLGFDVTEKRTADEKVKFQAKLLDTIGQAVIATDFNGKIIYWNKAATNMYGWLAREVMGKHVNDITPSPENKEEANAILNDLKKGNAWNGEFLVKRKDGSVFPALVSSTAIWDHKGNIQGIIGVSVDISMQKELQKQEEQLALVAAKTNDAVIITDADGYTTWVNKSFIKLTGYTLAEARGIKPGDLLQGPETDIATKKRISQCIKNQQPCQEIILNYGKDGRKYWLDLTIDPVFDDKGQLKHFIAIEKDVTEQIKEKEQKEKDNQELKWTKELLEQTSQVAEVGGWDYNLETESLSWTSVTKQIFEVGEDYVPELKSVGNFFKVKQEHDAVIHAMQNLIQNGTPYDVTAQIITARGNHRWVRSIGKREFKDGKCLRIFGVNQNIDEQKRANQKFENIRQAIDQHTLVSVTDLNGVITDVNDIFCQTTQYSREELIGSTHKIINSQYHSTGFFANMWQTLKKGKTWKGEVNNKRKDGTTCWMLSTIVPFFDLNGNLEEYVSIRTDITSQKLAEEDKQKTVEVISEQRNKLLDFSYILSHNIRSHSSNILGITDLLQNSNSTEKQNELIAVLQKSANNLDDTLRHLNDLLKIQSNFHNKKQTVIINKVVDKILRALSQEIEELKAIVSVDIENNLYTQTDPVYLNDILQNLINNALRFRHPNRKPEIYIGANRINGKIQVIVKDNGLGINLKKYGNKLFGMYKTFHNNSRSKGVGLFLAKNQVEALGGSITVESEENKGSTFRIEL